MNIYRSGWVVLCLCCWLSAGAQHAPRGAGKTAETTDAAFTVVPLGVRGGLDESNLSAYMVAASGSNAYICLDAGTLYAGIRKAVDSGVFATSVSNVLRNYIKAYFISHAHLDHVAGLIINSPEDSAKSIYGLPFCLDVLKEKYFSWASWANFGDEGEKPVLKKYHYAPMTPAIEVAVPLTALSVTAYPLSHGSPYQSTAFLVQSGQDYLLYLGDTGADTVEHSNKLHLLWEAVAPIVRSGRLKGMFIEVSFPDEQPVKLLFGHLTPKLLGQEISELAGLSGASGVRGLPVVITHRKPSGDQEGRIRQELEANPSLSAARLVFPEQGKRLSF